MIADAEGSVPREVIERTYMIAPHAIRAFGRSGLTSTLAKPDCVFDLRLNNHGAMTSAPAAKAAIP
jgi:hypothetical protein